MVAMHIGSYPLNVEAGEGEAAAAHNMTKINMELEKELREERDRLHLLHTEEELANFITSQELDNSKRSLARLKESTALLEEECRALRAREQRDRERMKSLQEELETKERVCKEKLIELKTENTRAMNEVYHWKKKYGELEARALRMVEENLKETQERERERNAPKLPRNAVLKSIDSDDAEMVDTSEEGILLTPEPKRMRTPKVESSDIDEEDFAPIGDLRKKKRLAEVPPSQKPSAPIPRHCGVRDVDGAEETSAKVTKARCTQKAAEVGLPSYPKGRAYTGRTSSRVLQVSALMRAEKRQSELKSCHPSFVRSILRSHMSSGFWLGIPSKFCKDNLPPNTLRMVLEDEKDLECETTYIGSRGLSGGWRAFALSHDLEIGDALVFELITPTRFKVYIFKAISEGTNKDIVDNVADKISSARGAKSIIRRRIF
ncbi:uncharacterized protein M6B38_302340 [Iris pallida]|uniref:TF-B3 domain-containing protein n=1 Tax=Iris pallida TaxID=29817 RepID=A0AAX6HN53_IRIPA|nr:uncharacterized protein M6B38_302340 [Iris pallida]